MIACQNLLIIHLILNLIHMWLKLFLHFLQPFMGKLEFSSSERSTQFYQVFIFKHSSIIDYRSYDNSIYVFLNILSISNKNTMAYVGLSSFNDCIINCCSLSPSRKKNAIKLYIFIHFYFMWILHGQLCMLLYCLDKWKICSFYGCYYDIGDNHCCNCICFLL